LGSLPVHPVVTIPNLKLGDVPITSWSLLEPNRNHHTITDPARLAKIVAFARAHADGWGNPWYGTPVGNISLEIYANAGPPREVVDEVIEVDGRQLRVTCLSIGSPHCVVRLDGATEGDVRHFGPLIETHSNFPNRTNVQFLEVVSREQIRIGIWERGAGYTLSSGSSA
jgi:hypothetical protein